jgi:hypothetical protein
MYKTSKCSKNYVNCRKHPARTGDSNQKFKEDYKIAQISAHEDYFSAKQAVEAITEDTSTYQKNKLKQELKNTEKVNLALINEAAFKRLEANPVWADGKKMSPQDYAEIKKHRETIKEQVRTNIEREEYYAKDITMNSFQEAVTKVLIDEGEFFDTKVDSWGDSRGSHDYEAGEHFKECGVKGVNSYDEEASWALYDSFSRDDTVGVKAELSCNCGDCYKKTVFMQNVSVSNMISKIMNYSN